MQWLEIVNQHWIIGNNKLFNIRYVSMRSLYLILNRKIGQATGFPIIDKEEILSILDFASM
jgi:hypothetical protein